MKPFNVVSNTRHGPMIHNDLDIYVGGALKTYGEYGELEGRFICSLAAEGDTVLDVGANFGVFTIQLARTVGPAGSVLALEPQRYVFQALCGNLALNNIANVRAFNAAAGAKPGSINVPVLDPYKAVNMGGVSLADKWKPGDKVPVLQIDAMSLKACSLIKVDVEGMELDVLRGAAQTIKKFKPALYVENDRKDNSKKLLEWIAGNGYRMWWHTPMLFNTDNFNKNPMNLYGPLVSHNVVCVHKSVGRKFDLPEIADCNEWWE